MKISNLLFSMLFLLLITAACQNKVKEPEMHADEEQTEAVETSSEKNKVIEAVLKNQDGVDIGMARLKEKENGVEIQVKADHLPAGLHGFHIHEHGRCDAPAFESAGGHFNPTEMKHGFQHADGPHGGDLENLEVDEDGTVDQTFFNEHVTLKENEANSLLNGTSLIIHQNEDDYVSQPAGDAGDRIGCGIISSGE